MSEKSLHDMLVELAKTDNATAATRNRIAFFAVIDEVKKEIAVGWPSKQIWRALYVNKRIKFSYQTFLKYVSTYITDPKIDQRKHVVPLEVETRSTKKKENTWGALKSKRQITIPLQKPAFGNKPIDEDSLF